MKHILGIAKSSLHPSGGVVPHRDLEEGPKYHYTLEQP